MVHIAGEIVINRPIDAVFDFVADERNEARYNPACDLRRADLGLTHRPWHAVSG